MGGRRGALQGREPVGGSNPFDKSRARARRRLAEALHSLAEASAQVGGMLSPLVIHEEALLFPPPPEAYLGYLSPSLRVVFIQVFFIEGLSH